MKLWALYDKSNERTLSVHLLNSFSQLAAEKKRNNFLWASQTNFDPSFFVRALEIFSDARRDHYFIKVTCKINWPR